MKIILIENFSLVLAQLWVYRCKLTSKENLSSKRSQLQIHLACPAAGEFSLQPVGRCVHCFFSHTIFCSHQKPLRISWESNYVGWKTNGMIRKSGWPSADGGGGPHSGVRASGLSSLGNHPGWGRTPLCEQQPSIPPRGCWLVSF